MKNKTLFAFVFIILLSFLINAEKFKTIPELTNYKKTSTYNEVITFIKNIQKTYPENIHIKYFATTTEGRKIPLVILSEEGISKPSETIIFKKPPVLIMANIHAGEVEGKEAVQMLIREIFIKGRKDLLKNQTILLIPIFNCDGNERKSAKNRRDNGPRLAGERKNGQGYDLNRDYIKLETPEVRGLVSEIFNKWDPVLFVDMHTTNGSYHQEPVTYAPNISPEGNITLTEYMWKKALPAIDKILKNKYGIESIPYGNFIKKDKPEKGWKNDANNGIFGTNYFGLRNRFSILDENYSHSSFKTRVKGAFGFLRAVLEYTSNHIKEMSAMVQEADLYSINSVKNSEFPIKFKTDKTYDFIIKSYKFKKRRILDSERERYPKKWYGDYLIEKTDIKKDYKTTLFATYSATETVKLPIGYILLPSEKSVAKLLKTHGITVIKIDKTFKTKIKRYSITDIKPAKQLFQGHYLNNNIEYNISDEEVLIEKGSFFISLSQPLSRLVAFMLEPKSRDSLIKWNFFDRVIVRQWHGYSFYPVFKIYSYPKTETSIF
jgi:hypothetical protein